MFDRRSRRSNSGPGDAFGHRSTYLQPYLDTLREMRIVNRNAPITALDDERGFRYGLADDFMRFWFRFVFPFQEELKTGLTPRTLYDLEIADALADRISPTFEGLCRNWVRGMGTVTKVGSWWGNALNQLRRDHIRETEEIDVVGLRRGAVAIIGECKWTARQMGSDVLADIETYKIPALRQAGARIAKDAQVALFSRSGFAPALVKAAAQRDDLLLIRVADLVHDLGVPTVSPFESAVPQVGRTRGSSKA